MPVTPKLPNTPAPRVLDSPIILFNTPSKLDRFLQAAESNGVPGVHSYHVSLSTKGYGPDIMHHVSVSDLVEVGVSPGDAIRLREYASKWWAEECQRVAKRQRTPDAGSSRHRAASSLATPVTDSTPPNKRLRFEKRFNDGGGMTTYGRAIVDVKGGYDFEENDYTWWVYSKDLKMDIPIPLGKVPVLADDPPYIDDDGNVF
jgi:hypothetical protein